MGKLYITEYAQLGPDSLGRTNMSPQEPPIASQVITYTTSVQSAAFNAATRLVRVHTDSICSLVFGTDPTATTADQRLVAGQTQFHSVRPDTNTGMKLAAIANT